MTTSGRYSAFDKSQPLVQYRLPFGAAIDDVPTTDVSRKPGPRCEAQSEVAVAKNSSVGHAKHVCGAL
jgi:hypothetical protein